jgi:hypothetical protein
MVGTAQEGEEITPMKQQKDNKDKPMGKAKRDIKAGDVVAFTIKGSTVSSPDIKLNEHGRVWVLNKVQYADERIRKHFESTGWTVIEDQPVPEK